MSRSAVVVAKYTQCHALTRVLSQITVERVLVSNESFRGLKNQRVSSGACRSCCVGAGHGQCCLGVEAWGNVVDGTRLVGQGHPNVQRSLSVQRGWNTLFSV